MASRKHLNLYLGSLDPPQLREHLKVNKHSQNELDEALKWTCFSGTSSLVNLLIEFGANPNSCDQFGTTVLHFAARGRREDVILALVKNGANFDDWLSDGESFLHWACHNGFLQIVDILLSDFQKSANDTDANGRRLLHLACLYGQAKVVDLLINNDDVDIDLPDDNGSTPLHYACSNSSEDHSIIIRLLIKNKADPMIQTPNGKTALDLAYECGRADVLIDELSTSKMVHLLISMDNVAASVDGPSARTKLKRNVSRGISFKSNIKQPFSEGLQNHEGVELSVVWRKILQNDDTEMLNMLKDSGVWQGIETEPFERAQNISMKEMSDLFDDCYENGLAVYSYVKLNFQQEISDGDFKSIFECLTGLTGFDMVEIDGCNIFEVPYASLTFLALICGRFRVVDCLLRMRQFDVLPMGLLMTLIARRLQRERSFPEQVQETLMKFSDSIESLLVDALNRIFLKDNSTGKKVSLDTLSVPLKSYARLSLIDLADKAKCTSFLCLPCCQAVLDERWYGKLSSMSTGWRWLTSLFPVLFLMYMTINQFSNDLKPRRKISTADTSLNKAKHNAVIRHTTHFRELSLFKRLLYVRYVFCSPSVKFVYHSLCHFVFLSVFSYVVLYDFHYKFTIPEYFCISFVAGYGVEELRQFILVSKSSSPIYYLFDVRNWLDMTAIAITSAGFGTRCFCLFNDNSVLPHIESHDPVLFMARAILLTGLLFFFIRIIFILSIYPILGPKLKMIGDMLVKDLVPLLSIFVIFLVAFGVVFQGLLYPNGFKQEDRNPLPPGKTVLSLFKRAFYGMFSAEYTADQIDCENGECNSTLGSSLVLYVYNVIYVLIVNILLVNLLIALFSNTVSRIDQQSQAHWLADRYKMVEEYKERSIFPPPLNLLTMLAEIIIYSFYACLSRFCCVKIRRAVSTTSQNKMFASMVLIKFLIIQSFALKERRNLLGVNTGHATEGGSKGGVGCGLGKLEGKIIQLEEVINRMAAKLDDLIQIQKTSDKKETAKSVIQSFAHRMSRRTKKKPGELVVNSDGMFEAEEDV